MPTLLIKCPTTEKIVDTGHQTNKDAFDRGTYKLSGTIGPCPHCGATHAWSNKDVDPETWRQH